MFILIKYMLGNFIKVYIVGKVFPLLSVTLLYPKESFSSNFKTARKKRFFNGAASNWFLYITVNKRILFQLINKSLIFNLIAIQTKKS